MDTSLIERLERMVSYFKEMAKMDQDDAGEGTMLIIDQHDIRTLEDAIEALKNA